MFPQGRRRALRARALAGTTACAAALWLLACGSAKAPVHAAASEQAAELKAEVKFQDFASCLREHGIEAESDGHGLRVNSSSEAAMKGAEKACARYRPSEQKGPNRMSAQERVDLEEKLQRFAKCMRQHGIQVEAIAPGGRPQINIHATPGGANPDSPAFKTAQKACSALLPGGGASSAAGGS